MAEIWGIATAAVVAAGATAYASKSASDSASAANKTNADNAQATNDLNYKMFQQGRGADGNAILPLYLPQGTEQALASRALQTTQAEQDALGTPAQQISNYEAIASGLTPAMQAGDTLVNQLFSGDLEKQQESNIAPVLAARGAIAGAQKTGILEALSARLNAISADRARAGYTGGGSSFERARLTSAAIPALQAAATTGAQADLANATDVANTKNSAIATRLQNLNTPLAQAANRIQLNQLPGSAASASAATAMEPLNFFKLNPGTFQATRLPLVNPVPGIGQIAGTAVASGASALGNYFQQQQLAKALTPAARTYTTGDYMQQQQMLNESSGAGSSGLFDSPVSSSQYAGYA